MAKPKPATSRRRPSKKDEVNQPDEVLTQLQRLSEHLDKHFRRYAIGLGVLIVVTLLVNWLVEHRTAGKVGDSQTAEAAVGALIGSVAAPGDDEKLPLLGEKDPPKAQFPTEKARYEAAKKAVDAALDLGGDLGTLAKAVDGRVKLGLGDYDGAEKAFGAYSEKAGENASIAPIVLESRGRAAESKGDKGAAAGWYEKLAAQSDPYYVVRGNVLLGDLYARDPAAADKARKHYAAALDALKPAEGQVLPGVLRGLRSEISRRQASL